MIFPLIHIRGSPRQYFRSFGLFLIIREKLPLWQRNSGRFARHDYFSPANIIFQPVGLRDTKGWITVDYSCCQKATFHAFKTNSFKTCCTLFAGSLPMWASLLQRGDMLMNLLVSSRKICLSCLGVDYLSFSLSIPSFNSIISSYFGECWNTSFIHAIRLDTQLFYLY